MRKVNQWSAAALTFKTREFDARTGSEIMFRINEVEPVDLLKETEVLVGGQWLPLTEENIDLHVHDEFAVLTPLNMLELLLNTVKEHNFGFVINRKSVRFPTRFQKDAGKMTQSEALDPLLAMIVGSGRATLRELEEYYSFRDAYDMADLITAETVNRLLANEQAEKEAAKNRG
ncbi:hypothetical protein [Pantoea sp. A4]|uniref:hypothetical protein n=1 Tax=Pantoea sp. A4 TaxID=1225184 RepID=UPI000362725A|nr:hypothetical protein [Pantoea sp. A4]